MGRLATLIIIVLVSIVGLNMIMLTHPDMITPSAPPSHAGSNPASRAADTHHPSMRAPPPINARPPPLAVLDQQPSSVMEPHPQPMHRPSDSGLGRASGEKKVVCYAITMTKDGKYMDGAAVLGHAIHLAHRSSAYEYELVAIVHPEVRAAFNQTSCSFNKVCYYSLRFRRHDQS